MNNTLLTTITVGQRLSNFTSVDVTVERIARGGFGIVYFGPDQAWEGRWRALKTMRPEVLRAGPRVRELFIREGLTWVGLWPHANLLTAHFVTEINSQPFLALDYAPGGSLRNLLHIAQPFDARFAWAQHIAAGLAAIHTPDPEMLRSDPLVHRDLKPNNVLVMGNGFAVITDFGLAKAVETDAAAVAVVAALQEATEQTIGATSEAPSAAATRSRRYQTQRGAALGTYAYMASEQWEDAASADRPADMYAFGIILSELLAGRHALLDLEVPHTEAAWREAHATGRPRPLREQAPELPAAVEDLYQALLAKRSEERPTAAQALEVLRSAAVALGEDPYDVPEVFRHTDENRRIMWLDLAIAYRRFGYFEEALACNDQVLAVAPDNFGAWLSRGNILGDMNRVNEALEAYGRAEQSLSPGDSQHRGWLWEMRGAQLSKAGRYAEAEAEYARAAEVQPNDSDAIFNRAVNEAKWGEAALQVGHPAEAQTHFERGLTFITRALTLNPNDPAYHQLQAALQLAFRRALAQQAGG